MVCAATAIAVVLVGSPLFHNAGVQLASSLMIDE
jgi:hypothetical protein